MPAPQVSAGQFNSIRVRSAARCSGGPAMTLHYNRFSIAATAAHIVGCVVSAVHAPLPYWTLMSRSTSLIAIALTAFLLFASFPARSDEVSEVNRLHRSGQTMVAIPRAEKFLVANPDDAPMRFLLGVMLADSQRSAEATEVFLKLTLDHPELAESYNNLAALHAAAGDYEKARAALEQALRINPNYATAHENLGDVYAILASQAYGRAARLDPGNASLKPKLALVRELFTSKSGVASPRVKAAQ